MDDLMARTMVENLCLGINPLTGKSLNSRDICSNEIIQDALRTVLANCTLESYASQAHKERMARKASQATYEVKRPLQSLVYRNSGLPWTLTDDQQLRELYARRYDTQRIANIMGRSPSAICSRIKKLKL